MGKFAVYMVDDAREARVGKDNKRVGGWGGLDSRLRGDDSRGLVFLYSILLRIVAKNTV